jgi:hypothetical protein
LEVSFLSDEVSFSKEELDCINRERIDYILKIPQCVIRDGININGGMLKVYGIILSFVNLSEDGKLLNNIIHPSYEKIASLSGFSNGYIKTCIEELEKVFLIRVVRDRDERNGGKRKHNLYQLMQVPDFIRICAAFCDLKSKPSKAERNKFKDKLIKTGYYEKAARESKPLLYLLDSTTHLRNEDVPLINEDVKKISNYMVEKKFPNVFSLTYEEIEALIDSDIGHMVKCLVVDNKAALKRKGILFDTSQKDSYLKGIIAFFKTHKKSPNPEELRAIDQILVIKDINPKHLQKAIDNLKKSELPFSYDVLLKEAIRIKDMKQEVGTKIFKQIQNSKPMKRKQPSVERTASNFFDN